ncbi:MAG TPA: hypothetical protein VGO03_16055 [Acidimicrobiia bacterium]|jgi:hypothetical protein
MCTLALVEFGEAVVEDSKEIVRLARPLYKVATVVEFFVVAGIVAGVIAGCILIAHRVPTGDPAETRHPFVGAGVATMAGSLLGGTVWWCVARAARVLAIDTASRNGESVLPPPRPPSPARPADGTT